MLCSESGRISGQQVQFGGPEPLDQISESAHALGVKPVIPVPSLFPR